MVVHHTTPSESDFLEAVFTGNTVLVYELLCHPDVNITNPHHALVNACNRNYPDMVNMFLVDRRFDPTTGNLYALKSACQFGHREIIRLLLTDPRVRSHSAFSLFLYSIRSSPRYHAYGETESYRQEFIRFVEEVCV
jgi:hypothetical protein